MFKNYEIWYLLSPWRIEHVCKFAKDSTLLCRCYGVNSVEDSLLAARRASRGKLVVACSVVESVIRQQDLYTYRCFLYENLPAAFHVFIQCSSKFSDF